MSLTRTQRSAPYVQCSATTEIIFIHRKREMKRDTKERKNTQEVNVENPKLGEKTTAAHRLQTITMWECTTVSSLRQRPRAHKSSPQVAVTIEATTSFSLSLSLCTVTHSHFLHQQEKSQRPTHSKRLALSHIYTNMTFRLFTNIATMGSQKHIYEYVSSSGSYRVCTIRLSVAGYSSSGSY